MPFVGKHTRTECIAQDHLPFNRRVTQLEYNMMNLSVGRNPLGGNKSRSQLLYTLRLMDYDDLRPIIGTKDNPLLPSFWKKLSASPNKWRSLFDKATSKQGADGLSPQLPSRIMVAADTLKQCPREFTSWMTIVTSPCLTYQDALVNAEKDAERLERMFRARHPDGIMAITAEVDVKRVKEVPDGLFRNTKWRRGLGPNQIVYIVHFHGVGYAPGILPSEMQDSFVRTPSGKWSKFYAGKNQVRCLPLYEQSENEPERDDIENCFRYAVKCHYRPPSKKRMLEIAPQWLLLTDMIHSNKKLTRIVGLRKPIRIKCDQCSSAYDQGTECGCKHKTNVNASTNLSRIVSDMIAKLKLDSSLIPFSTFTHKPNVYLNCPAVTTLNTRANRQEKKKLANYGYTERIVMSRLFRGQMPAGP